MNRIRKMEYWTLICSILSAIASIGLFICTLIGFWFISKQTENTEAQTNFINQQTNIAKNKDILFSLQQDLFELINNILSNIKKHENLSNENYFIVLKNLTVKEDFIKTGYKYNINNLDFIVFGTIKDLFTIQINNSSQRIIEKLDLYKWWLGNKYYKKLYDIIKLDEINCIERYKQKYSDIVKELSSMHTEKLYNLKSYELTSIKDKIDSKMKDFHKNDIDTLNNNIKVFLDDLSKAKGF